MENTMDNKVRHEVYEKSEIIINEYFYPGSMLQGMTVYHEGSEYSVRQVIFNIQPYRPNSYYTVYLHKEF